MRDPAGRERHVQPHRRPAPAHRGVPSRPALAAAGARVRPRDHGDHPPRRGGGGRGRGRRLRRGRPRGPARGGADAPARRRLDPRRARAPPRRACPLPRRARPRLLAQLPPLGVRERRPRPRAAAGGGLARRRPRPAAAPGHLRRLDPSRRRRRAAAGLPRAHARPAVQARPDRRVVAGADRRARRDGGGRDVRHEGHLRRRALRRAQRSAHLRAHRCPLPRRVDRGPQADPAPPRGAARRRGRA